MSTSTIIHIRNLFTGECIETADFETAEYAVDVQISCNGWVEDDLQLSYSHDGGQTWVGGEE